MELYEIVLIVSAIIASAMWIMLLYRMRAYAVLVFLLMVLGVSEAYLIFGEYAFKWHLIAAISPALGALIYAMIRIRLRIKMILKQIDTLEKEKAREARMEKIRTGAAEMAQLYRSDPELKELNEFVGDFYEPPSQGDCADKKKGSIDTEKHHGNKCHLL